jgi:V/A-type H+-transporting ATPase subunit D
MAMKIQYNKTFMQRIRKMLDTRVKALPTLKNKESALRVEVKKAKDTVEDLDRKLEEKKKSYQKMMALWSEFNPELVSVKEVKYTTKKIAGVQTPVLQDVDLDIKPFSIFNNPAWFMDGIETLREYIKLAIERDFFQKKMEILLYARKKTTQKVNLYEKVQIPEFQDALRKIKRFLEDQENLSKSSQKIIKKRKAIT